MQYRHKTASYALKREQATALAALTQELSVPLIVNDDVALALHVGAQSVHLGREDGDIAAARRLCGDALLIGVSCYDDFERARLLLNPAPAMWLLVPCILL